MVDLPELARDASEATKSKARNLLPWLETPKTCDNCGELCIATVTYDPRQCLYVDCWQCNSCQATFYREEDWAEETIHAPDFSR